MKIKKRIKRALAAFLREELMDYIGYNHNIPYMSLNDRYLMNNIAFETLVMEAEIPISINNNSMQLEEYIRDCKRRFADQVIDNIQVDAQTLVTNKDFMNRSVVFRLRVERKDS